MDPSYLVHDQALGANCPLDWQIVEPARTKKESAEANPEVARENSPRKGVVGGDGLTISTPAGEYTQALPRKLIQFSITDHEILKNDYVVSRV